MSFGRPVVDRCLCVTVLIVCQSAQAIIEHVVTKKSITQAQVKQMGGKNPMDSLQNDDKLVDRAGIYVHITGEFAGRGFELAGWIPQDRYPLFRHDCLLFSG